MYSYRNSSSKYTHSSNNSNYVIHSIIIIEQKLDVQKKQKLYNKCITNLQQNNNNNIDFRSFIRKLSFLNMQNTENSKYSSKHSLNVYQLTT